ncbi:MAG TPA: hypothetical protein VNQ76_11220, partial [Planctomicrobium sp.]|nr:hypothetical protein [Planctomicrobium sp.]
MKKTIFSFFLALSGMCAISAAHADTALFDLPDLSQAAKDSLVAHYDGRTGVETDDNVVKSWTPVDGSGKPLAPMIVNTSGTDQKGITYDSSTATLKFDDRNGGTRSLVGTLGNTAGSAFTVFWKGCYDPSAPYASSGTYVYNIGPNKIAHKRDGSDGGWRVELYNGRAYGGDDITAYDDVPATVWSTVITAKSHKGYANGTNLNVTGSPSYAVPANAAIRIGAYSGKGYDLQGDISQLIIFQSALSDEDRQIVEDYLKQIAVGDPSVSSDKSGYFGSEEIQVVFLHGPGNAGDKIAVLPAGAVPGQSAPLFETPTSGTSGKVTFSSTKLPQGNYSLWYLSANNGVIAGPTGIAIDPVTTLTVDKTQYNPGEPITATFASGPGNARDYIGIYPSHIMPTRASGRLTWQYANGTSSAGGNVTAGNVTIPTNYVVP